jgi:hypothetical protein
VLRRTRPAPSALSSSSPIAAEIAGGPATSRHVPG